MVDNYYNFLIFFIIPKHNKNINKNGARANTWVMSVSYLTPEKLLSLKEPSNSSYNQQYHEVPFAVINDKLGWQ